MTQPNTVEERKQRLRAMLHKAVVLELSTLPPYLTALWSIRPGTNLEAATIVRSVLMEEMLHMTLAANVLSAVGGTVNLGADAIPAYPLQLDFDAQREGQRVVDIHLARFSRETVDSFMQIELPEGFASPTRTATAPNLVVPDFTIGQFYDDIVEELRVLCDELGPGALFSGQPGHQIAEGYFWKGGGRPIVVTDLTSAHRAIRVISTQGEGASRSLFDGDKHFFGQPEEVAHYFRLNQILAGRYYAMTDSIHGAPSGNALAVDFGAVFPIKPDCRHTDFAGDARLTGLSEKFNAAYSMMLWQLMEGFGGNPAVFYTATMNGMSGLGELARTMVQIPIRGDREHRHAAPTFEWNAACFGLSSTGPVASDSIL